nr:flagellin [Selenomonas ruminantium]
MDHLFAYEAGSREWSEFNVLTSKNREALLGNQVGKTRSGKNISTEEEGLLDHALNYLIGANCLVGAQNMRLKMTEANIVTQRESTTASESTLRDADMAKEMTAYTKNNVLVQAAQSMLAQANQNNSGVLNLLQ